jgi:hypothetical protein
MRRPLFVIILLAGLLPGMALSQDQQSRPVPSAPGSAEPTWQRTVRLSDGRTFVTDGGLAIDAALAKPATLPADVLPSASGSFIERHMSSQSPDEVGLPQLVLGPDGRTYTTPNGIHLNQTYIDFLRRILPSAQVRLRTQGGREPVVILLKGEPVGVFMPVAR